MEGASRLGATVRIYQPSEVIILSSQETGPAVWRLE